MGRILLVEDELKVADAVSAGLRAEGYDVVQERTGEGGFFRASTETFDIILLDLGLPDRDGLEILSALRGNGMKEPVLIMTARDAVEDRVAGLDAGADDYMIKPFSFAELLARVRALIRRGAPTPGRLRAGDLVLDLLARTAQRAGRPLDLTVREFQVLECLMRHQGHVVTRENLTRENPTCCFGNPNLKPESSTNVNGSVGTLLYTGDTVVNLEAIGFYRTVTDLILDVDDGSGETTITANRPDEVKVRGFSLVGSATLTSALSGSLGYTYTNSERRQDVAGGYDSLPGIPDQLVQASVDLHPPSLPFGAMLTVNRVGEMLNTVAGFGSVGSGDYTLVDLSGRVFVDRSRRHRINLRFENLFDTEYSTQYRRGFPDLSSTPFLVHFLGMPRTFHMSYSFSY